MVSLTWIVGNQPPFTWIRGISPTHLDTRESAVEITADRVVTIHYTLLALTQEPLISCNADASDKEVAELFDKYNLRALPVVNDDGKLVGVVEADHVIAFLRQR